MKNGKNNYDVILQTEFGTFDNATFTNLKEAKKWASGRHMYRGSDGTWKKYTVIIFKNGESFLVYETY